MTAEERAAKIMARALAHEGFVLFADGEAARIAQADDADAGGDPLVMALADFLAERYEAAVQGFEIVMESPDRLSDRELDEVHLIIGRCLAASGVSGVAAALQAVQGHEALNFDYVLVVIGQHFQAIGRATLARSAYKRLCRLNPIDDAGVRNLCLLLEEACDYDESIPLLERYHQAGGGSAEVAILAVRVAMARCEWAGHQQILDRCLKLFPDEARLWQASCISGSIAGAPLSAVHSARQAAALNQDLRFLSFRCQIPISA